MNLKYSSLSVLTSMFILIQTSLLSKAKSLTFQTMRSWLLFPLKSTSVYLRVIKWPFFFFFRCLKTFQGRKKLPALLWGNKFGSIKPCCYLITSSCVCKRWRWRILIASLPSGRFVNSSTLRIMIKTEPCCISLTTEKSYHDLEWFTNWFCITAPVSSFYGCFAERKRQRCYL